MLRPFLTSLCLLVVLAGVNSDGDSCYSYAGGSVYPTYVRASGDHDLSTTKAFSEWTRVNNRINLIQEYYVNRTSSSSLPSQPSV